MTNDKILQILKDNNIEYKLFEHKAIYTIAEGVKLNIPANSTAKNLFLCDRKRENYYLFTLYKDTQISLKELQKKIQSKRLSFVAEEELQTILGLQKGCVSPLGIFNNKAGNVNVFIDEYFKNKPVAVPLNKNTITILLNTNDLMSILKQSENKIYWLNV